MTKNKFVLQGRGGKNYALLQKKFRKNLSYRPLAYENRYNGAILDAYACHTKIHL